MLPIIKEENLHDISKIKKSGHNLKTNRSLVLQNSQNLEYYEQKLLEEIQLNERLKMKYESVKFQVTTSLKPKNDRDGLEMKEKQIDMQEKHLQQKIRLLDNLISENNKMKNEVNSQRNQRHEIHGWEQKYKNLLIEKKVYETAIQKIKQKFEKAKIKLLRQQKYIEEQRLKRINSNQLGIDQIQNRMSKKVKMIKVSQQKFLCEQKQNKFEFDFEFELEQKKTFFNDVEKKIKFITQVDNLVQGIQKLKIIEKQNQKLFYQIESEEKRQKDIKNNNLKTNKIIGQFSNGLITEQRISKTVLLRNSQKQLFQQIYHLQKQNSKISEKLSLLIDFDVRNLSGQQALRHTMRKKYKSKTDKKKLDKMLEQTGKKKNQYIQLLTPQKLRLEIIKNKIQ